VASRSNISIRAAFLDAERQLHLPKDDSYVAPL
jgi:hypothetical protein